MSQSTSIRELLQKSLDMRPSNMVQGVVKSLSPLEIQVLNDAELLVTESNVFVPRHLTNYEVDIQLAGSIAGEYIGRRKATVYNGLKKDDMVYMFAYNRGALYYILDKVGG